MFWIALFCFLVCAAGLLHTYVLYPLGMQQAARGLPAHAEVFAPGDPDLPVVSVLMSLYNEEKVIADKLASLFAQTYPAEKLWYFIGSDCSSDATNRLVTEAAAGRSGFFFFPFAQRRGKPPVINDLAREALLRHPAGPGHVFLLTDASVMLSPDVIHTLVRHFRDRQIGLVDARMQNVNLSKQGISMSEQTYIGGETLLKHAESVLWGQMMGPFGGCYALRSDLFEPIPDKHLVDDFFLAFRALEKGYKAINDLEAVCTEGATHRVQDEFRRKKRIAAGSFQNLAQFRRWVLPPATTLGFAFFSHKVLRWLGGFFLLLTIVSAGVMGIYNQFWWYVFCVSILVAAGLPLLHTLLERLRIPGGPIRHLAYFISMNAALVAGYVQWKRGIRGSVWQRTNRY
ncbi:MAG: glycosyltransferase family 2 protein [Saprospiraceae bacterium]|nr:glycosyltransferase family 2 protein [Saprospiraceae bacterium]